MALAERAHRQICLITRALAVLRLRADRHALGGPIV